MVRRMVENTVRVAYANQCVVCFFHGGYEQTYITVFCSPSFPTNETKGFPSGICYIVAVQLCPYRMHVQEDVLAMYPRVSLLDR